MTETAVAKTGRQRAVTESTGTGGTGLRASEMPKTQKPHAHMFPPFGVHVPNVPRYPNGFRDWGAPKPQE